MKIPKVSVIIPAYNSEKFIKETIDSVFNQTYQDFELIMVDGSYSDETENIISVYGDRIKYLRIKNEGISVARNTGIKMSTGKYAAFIDHDDVWLPEKLEQQITLLENSKDIGIVFSDAYIISEDGEKRGNLFNISQPYEGMIFEKLLMDNFIPIMTVVIRKEVFNEIGFFDPQYKIAEDWDLFLRLSKKYPVAFINRPLAGYRVHKDSFSRNTELMFNEGIKIMDQYLPVLDGKLANVLRLKKCRFQFNLAIAYLQSKRKRMAVEFIFARIKEHPLYLRFYLGLAAALLPVNMVQILFSKRLHDSCWRREKKKAICLVLGAFYPDISGGAVQCYNLVQKLHGKFDFYVIATQKVSSKERPARGFFTEDMVRDVRIFRINLYPGKKLSEIVSFLAVFVIFFKIFTKVDIFHMVGYTRKSCIITLLARLFRKKVLVKTTSSGIDDPLSIKRKSSVCWLLYSIADSYILASPAQKKSFNETGLQKDKAFMISNGVDIDRFTIPDVLDKAALRKEMGIPDFAEVILSVGFFSKDKGMDILAESILFLPKDKLHNIFLILVGSRDTGVLEVDAKVVEKVYRSINTSGIGQRCLFVDETHNIERYYKVSDIFVLPSKREGLPNALLEAMACGLYCIASKLEGTTDYIISSGKDGYLLNTLDAVSLSDALADIIGDKELQRRTGMQARATIKQRFDMEEIKRNYAGLYNRLLNKQKGRCVCYG